MRVPFPVRGPVLMVGAILALVAGTVSGAAAEADPVPPVVVEPLPMLAPEVASCSTRTVEVDADVLNVRADPNPHAALLGQVNRGDRGPCTRVVTGMPYSECGALDNTWIQIPFTAEDRAGYLAAACVRDV
ncbi:hypothetical protein GCM10012275_50030 [Longimycelium tulufanense]|uniref:SH3 domain-containing protein n=1 Tax=Longimycelium tulufanense TaxID=907463 RepID=A0A8J3FXD1_9PSEU|nr:hypothetical protein [Longimycelium tulufanense]GGM73384.1 hypothetical protein GCM10012275_50030 [Longimycelium tulufanense]